MDTVNNSIHNQSAEEIVSTWHAAKQQLAALQKQERDLRSQMIAALSTGEIEEGTERVPIGHGKDLVITHKLNYTLDASDEAIESELDYVAKSMGEVVAERLVKFKPSLSVSEFKALDHDVKKRFARLVTTKPASPSVEIKDAK